MYISAVYWSLILQKWVLFGANALLKFAKGIQIDPHPILATAHGTVVHLARANGGVARPGPGACRDDNGKRAEQGHENCEQI